MRYLVAILFMGMICGCVHRQAPALVQLPTAEQVEISRLQDENQKLTLELAELTHNCSAVLRVFKEAGRYSRSEASKGK